MFRPFGQGDVILMIAIGMGLCGARRRALQIILTLAIMSMLIWPIKIGVGRERPAFKNFQSFPSGDAATAAAFVTPLASLSPWTWPTAVLITGGVASERVYYGRHYASDVLTGASLGILAGAIALAILRRWRWRPSRRWFAMAALLVLLATGLALFRARGAPYLLTVIRIWGPFGAFLMLTRLIPVWVRKQPSISRPHDPGITAIRWLSLTLWLTIGSLLLITPWFMPIFGLRIPLTSMGLIALCTAGVILKLQYRQRQEIITAITAAGATCILLTIGLSLYPAIQAFRASILTF